LRGHVVDPSYIPPVGEGTGMRLPAEMVGRLAELFEAQSAEAIAALLHGWGVTGHRGETGDCPLAVAVSEYQFVLGVEIDDDHLIVRTMTVKEGSLTVEVGGAQLTDAMKLFVKRFDDGEFPGLESHEPLVDVAL